MEAMQSKEQTWCNFEILRTEFNELGKVVELYINGSPVFDLSFKSV